MLIVIYLFGCLIGVSNLVDFKDFVVGVCFRKFVILLRMVGLFVMIDCIVGYFFERLLRLMILLLCLILIWVFVGVVNCNNFIVVFLRYLL